MFIVWFLLHASLRIVFIAYMIYNVWARLQSYEQIYFDLLKQKSCCEVFNLSKDSVFFCLGLLNSIVSFYSDTAETTKILLTQARLELLPSGIYTAKF